MSEQDNSTTEAVSETSADTSEAPATEASENAAVNEGEKSLGDAGKKALDAMKAERNQFRDDLKAIRAEFDAFRAKAEGKEAEFSAAQEAQRIKDEALAAANERILKAEVRAAAATKLADPQDALRFLDLSGFEVDSDGAVDAASIASAVDDLISRKPYLAAQGGSRFQGTADGGARKESKPATTSEQIAEAEAAGDWARASALKASLLLENQQST